MVLKYDGWEGKGDYQGGEDTYVLPKPTLDELALQFSSSLARLTAEIDGSAKQVTLIDTGKLAIPETYAPLRSAIADFIAPHNTNPRKKTIEALLKPARALAKTGDNLNWHLDAFIRDAEAYKQAFECKRAGKD